MHLIVYISEYVTERDSLENDINEIVSVSKKENPKHDITGVLFYHKGKFVQVIEGPEAELRSLMKNIESDNRHINLEYLLDQEIQKRSFQDWNMDCFNLSDQRSLDAEEMKKISEIYKAQFLVNSKALIMLYEALLEEGVFS